MMLFPNALPHGIAPFHSQADLISDDRIYCFSREICVFATLLHRKVVIRLICSQLTISPDVVNALIM